MSAWSFASQVYGSAWSTPAMRAIFDDEPRLRGWLEVLATLADVQGEAGLIPADDARDVASTCRAIHPDPDFLRGLEEDYLASGHSTAGLITAIARRCPGSSGQWVYYGVTVQDIADTWTMIALRDAGRLLNGDLARVVEAAGAIARAHRDTVMAGRTHGQQGLPITFGFKAAGWLVEFRRHQERLGQVSKRMGVGQLCGGVGSLSSLGPNALEVQRQFCERLGLRAPTMSWTASRDLFVEWAHLLVLIAGTADRIGHEVYTLQRDEIGELREGQNSRVIGSITMPHKRNPEASEQIGALSRVVRANAAMLAESLVHDHERDGRSWKVEWHAIPEATMAAGRALDLLASLLESLEVDAVRMRANLEMFDGYILSEAVMLRLARTMGRRAAHELVHEAAIEGKRAGKALRQVVADHPATAFLLPDLDRIFDLSLQAGQCAAQVDRALGPNIREITHLSQQRDIGEW